MLGKNDPPIQPPARQAWVVASLTMPVAMRTAAPTVPHEPMSALAPELLARGYQYYDWNVSSGDGGGVLSADELVANATAYGNFTNVILLCHDASAKTTTVEALPRIIEYYQSQGFVFQAITRETVVVHHGIQN